MEGDKHFSHDHPLTFLINKEVDDYEHEKPNYLCNICGLPILSIPSYTCSSCKFFLHKPCAEMPKELNHPRHDPELLIGHHSLHLKPKSPCDQNYFTYKCEGCMFELHPLVAASVEIKTNHISHQSHPLVLICRETLSECDACGEEQKGFFFCCQKCNFWIHQECTILPNVVKLPSHPNPFILTYSIPSFILKIRRCIICNKKRHLAYRGVYFCGEGTHLVAYVSCAKSSIKTHENGNSTIMTQWFLFSSIKFIAMPLDLVSCLSIFIYIFLITKVWMFNFLQIFICLSLVNFKSEG